MEEMWKDIPGYEGFYQASNLGRIKSLYFTSNYQHKTYLTYRLVASAFLENYLETDMTVNHKDGNRLNNNINNLEWVSRKENIQHGFKTGLYHNCKMVKIINKNNKYDKIFRSMSEASIVIGQNKGYISNKIKNNIYENKNFKWKLF